jgi:hypothetical protein
METGHNLSNFLLLQHEISVKAVDALRSVHGTDFKSGPAAVIICK